MSDYTSSRLHAGKARVGKSGITLKWRLAIAIIVAVALTQILLQFEVFFPSIHSGTSSPGSETDTSETGPASVAPESATSKIDTDSSDENMRAKQRAAKRAQKILAEVVPEAFGPNRSGPPRTLGQNDTLHQKYWRDVPVSDSNKAVDHFHTFDYAAAPIDPEGEILRHTDRFCFKYMGDLVAVRLWEQNAKGQLDEIGLETAWRAAADAVREACLHNNRWRLLVDPTMLKTEETQAGLAEEGADDDVNEISTIGGGSQQKLDSNGSEWVWNLDIKEFLKATSDKQIYVLGDSISRNINANFRMFGHKDSNTVWCPLISDSALDQKETLAHKRSRKPIPLKPGLCQNFLDVLKKETDKPFYILIQMGRWLQGSTSLEDKQQMLSSLRTEIIKTQEQRIGKGLEPHHIAFVSYMSRHYEHGDWDDGGHCSSAYDPDSKPRDTWYHDFRKLLEEGRTDIDAAVKKLEDGVEIEFAVKLLLLDEKYLSDINKEYLTYVNVTEASIFRFDGHAGPADCSHYVTPGPQTPVLSQILHAWDIPNQMVPVSVLQSSAQEDA
eukprot:Clim_evm28s151 gene=Clim_evmTU28s151